jgi:ribosome-binding factor A
VNDIKQKKLESSIIKAFSTLIISGKIKDPRVEMVSVHRVDISPDLSQVKLWISAYCDEKGRKSILKGLNSASGFIQGAVSKALKLRVTPHFIFVWDENFIKSFEVNQLIEKTRPKEVEETQSPDSI